MWTTIQAHKLWVLAATVAFLGAGMYLYAKANSGPSVDTLVVHPSTFLQQVSVSGKVVGAKNVDLGFTQGGRIAHVYAAVGDVVPAGTVLASIENGDLAASLLQKQASVAAEEAALVSLQAGTRPEEIAVAQSEVDNDTQALSQANSALLDAARSVYTKSDAAVRNDVYQFISGPRTTTPQLTFYDSDTQLTNRFLGEILTIESLLNTWSQNTGSTQPQDALALALSMQRGSGVVASFLSDASAVLARAIPSQGVTQSTINGYSSDVASGRAALDTAITALTAAITAQKNASAALDTAKSNLSLKQAGAVASDIEAQKARITAAQAEVANVRAQISRTLITAPFTGIVTTMDAKVGMIVSPNQNEVSMISANAFQIESYVPEASVALVKVGDDAAVTLDAYGPDVPFAAHIVSIDPAETVRDGVSTYRTVLEFAQKDARIRSGMTANVLITTDEREGVISVPQGIIVDRDGKHYVTVLTGKVEEEREVTTGALSSGGNIEITSGLTDGDTVVIRAAP